MKPSALYHHLPHDCAHQVRTAIKKGLAKGNGEAVIFFRADDIGVPGKQFSQLTTLFNTHQLPLCLAVVPTWLTDSRFQTLQSLTGPGSSQWCWHQHGWRHKNHEPAGKKQEFGPNRPAALQIADLVKGKNRLEHIMGKIFYPSFTPPWNRCSIDTLNGLRKLGFSAVSRSNKARPVTPAGLPDHQVNIDLHTRNDENPQLAFAKLLLEIEQSVSRGTAGVMIHHQRMNKAAVTFLGSLLETVACIPSLHPVQFTDLA